MPGFDGTGPMGYGPMTGGARGPCNPYGRGYRPYGRAQAFGSGRGFGRGFGPGLGRGRGFGRGIGRRGFYPAGSFGVPYTPHYAAPYPYVRRPEDELNMLKDDADAIRGELDAINKRIEELESKSPEA